MSRMLAAMIVMARDRTYEGLLEDLRGRKVLILTCNTCARFCGVGGREAAADLASRMFADGIDVEGVESSAACCFMKNAVSSMASAGERFDTVLAICCDVGARNAAEASGKPVVNPIITFGAGYLDRDGVPHAVSIVCGRTVRDDPLPKLAEESGCLTGPF